MPPAKKTGNKQVRKKADNKDQTDKTADDGMVNATGLNHHRPTDVSQIEVMELGEEDLTRRVAKRSREYLGYNP